MPASGHSWAWSNQAIVDKQFQVKVRDLVQPGTSALFLIVEKMTTDRVIEALSKFGGTVLRSSLSHKAEQELQRALHATSDSAAVPA